MALSDLVTSTIGRIVGRVVRRIVCWALVGLFCLIALYQASVAAVLALEAEFGAIYAHLMIAGFYAFAAIIILTFLWVTVRRPFVEEEYRKTLAQLPADAQIANVIEALLFGYGMSRRKSR